MPLDEINKKRLEEFGKQENYLYPSEDIAKDYSKYEDYLGKSTPLPEPEWDDARAKSQSGFEKVLNSTGQMVGTFGTALASTAATLVGGAVGLAAETADLALEGDQFNGMDIALNNPIMKGISDFDKYLKEDVMPTYYTKEQQNSLLSAATGTDLLNGLGFMASAMLPAGFITKSLGGLAKMTALAKVGKLEPILDAATKAGKISNIERQLISKTALHLDKAGPITGALVGRIGESAMEANGVYEEIVSNLQNQREQAQQEFKQYGETNHPEYLNLTDDEIQKKAKDLRNKDFMGNMALAVSDVAQYTRWFRGGGLGERLVKDGLKTVVKERGKGALLKDLLFEAGQEAGEEGYQFLLQKGAENSAKGKSYLEGISEASGDLFGTIEGQKSMLLGAILGGGMSSIANVKDAKENKIKLQAMANNLTANADTTQRYITDPETGKKIVNPELTKIATQFAFYEQLKDQALAEGDKDAYDVLEKTQFADLVAAKLESGQYDDFIDELKNMGESSAEEIESMFGELPTKNGIKLTPMQVAANKIAEAKRVKQQTEGLRLLPQLQNIDNNTMSYIRHKLFAQESLRNQIEDINNKISEVQSRAHYPIPVENQELTEPELEPQDEFELKKLVAKKDELVNSFGEIAQEFKQLIAKPKEAEQQVNDIHEKNIKDAVDNELKIINKEQNIANEAAKKLEELKKTAEEPIVVTTDNGQIEAVMQDGILVNSETGEPIEDELLEQFKKEVIDEEEIESEETPEEYDDTTEPNTFLEGPKKRNTYSTSTRGLDINYTESSSGRDARDIDNLFQYVLYESHKLITKWFSSPKNTPSNTKKFTAKLTEEPITQQLLNDINIRRLSKNAQTGLYPQLTLEDLQSPKYKPLRMRLYENGKLVKESEDNIIHFHDVDYFYETQAYLNILNDENLDKNQKELAIAKEINKLTAERTKLVNNLDVAILTVNDKSDGIINFLPNKNGIKRVLPISNLANQEGNYGIGYVKSIDENGVAIIDYNGLEFVSNRKDLKLGALVFDIISANGSHLINNNITKNKYTPEQIDSIAELLIYKITSGTDSIKVNGKEFNIKDLLRSLIYLGINKNNSESTIAFSKEGDTLIVGRDKKIDGKYDNSSKWDKKRAIEDRATLKQDLINLLSTNYHAYPNPDMKILNQKSNIIVFPTEINELGEAKGDIIPIQDFFLNGKEPMIGTNINPNIPFINSYFSFEINGEGLVFDVKKQNEPYASNLEGEIPTNNDFGFEETTETTTPVSTKTLNNIESIKENSKLDSNAANKKLAEIAKNENIDLSKLTREEYVDYAIRNGLKITDTELRNAPELRTPTTMDETMALRKSLRDSITEKTKDIWNKWTNSIELLASKSQKERYILDKVRVLSGTANSGSWLFFSVNDVDLDNTSAPYKSYFSLKDFNKISPDQVVGFMKFLQNKGYNGHIKLFQDLVNQGVLLNDQFVMHGLTEADAKLGEQLAKEYFKEEIKSTGFGKDGFENGKSKSYSQILSDKISNSIDDIINGKTNVEQPTLKGKPVSTDAKADIEAKKANIKNDLKYIELGLNNRNQILLAEINNPIATVGNTAINGIGTAIDINLTQEEQNEINQNYKAYNKNLLSALEFNEWRVEFSNKVLNRVKQEKNAELTALKNKEIVKTPEENKVNEQLKENEINCANKGEGIKLNPKPKFNFKK